MRIAYICDTREIGGAERCLVALAQEMAARGHEVHVLAAQEELVDWLHSRAPGAHVRRVVEDDYRDVSTTGRRAIALVSLFPRLVRALATLAPDVAHANNGGYPGSDLCRMGLAAARVAGVERRVMTVHGHPYPREHRSDPRIQAAADRLVWSTAQVVISPSAAVIDGLVARRRMPAALGQTIYNGVAGVQHDAQATARVRARLAPGGELLVGMVCARADVEKGHGVFLEALAAAGENVRGVLVGEPPDDFSARVRAAGLQRRLAIEGPREGLGDYYAAFDVLVVPSIERECLPLVILEAASVATPTFASRLAGIPEAIADGVEGRLFEPGSSAQLAELIGSTSVRQLTAMGRAARRRWQTSFQIGAMADATLATYELRPWEARWHGR